jgi:hypothetical protein
MVCAFLLRVPTEAGTLMSVRDITITLMSGPVITLMSDPVIAL